MKASDLDPRMYRVLEAIRPELLFNPIPEGTKICSSDLHTLAFGLLETIKPEEIDRIFTQFYVYLEASGAKNLRLSERVRISAIRRARAILNHDVIDICNRIEQLDAVFQGSLAGADQSVEWKCGQILYSAARFGGILRSDLLYGIVQAIKVRPQMLDEHLWLEISTTRDSEPYIWFPDPLTKVLLCNWYEIGFDEILRIEFRSHKKEWFALIRRFFIAQQVVWRKKGLKQTTFLGGLRAHLVVNAPAVVAHCAFGVHQTHTLKKNCYLRMLTRRVPVLEPGDEEDSNSSGEIGLTRNLRNPIGNSSLGKRNQELLRLVGRVLRKPGRRGAMAEEINMLVVEYKNDCSDMACYLSLWIAACLTTKNRWGNRYSPSTAYTALRAVARRLQMAFAAESPFDMSLESVAERYFEIIDMGDTRSLRHSIAKYLRQFHEYLEDEWGLASLGDHAPWVGLETSNAVVDAKIVLPHEYRAAVDHYKNRIDNSKQQEALLYRARSIVLTLGFRTGLRRTEIHLLRIQDVTTLGRQEIVIRSYLDRNLKSRAAVRRIPIDVLLNEEELSLLNEWLQLRRNQLAPSDDYLFAIPGSGSPYLKDSVIFDHIHWVLRNFTGDRSTRFHNLRHSCATLSFWSWMHPRYPMNGTKFSEIQHSSVEQILAQRRRLLDVEIGHEPSRKTLYALAMMIGHSGPSMTLEHYIHCIDWMLECEMDRLTPVLTKKALANLAGVSVRQIEKLSRGEPLTSKVVTARVTRKLRALAEHPDLSDWISPNEISLRKKKSDGIVKNEYTMNLWAAIQRYFIHGVPITELVEEFNLEHIEIAAAIGRATDISMMTFQGAGHNTFRHRPKSWQQSDLTHQFHRPPREKRDQALVKTMLNQFEALSGPRKKFVLWCVSYYIHNGEAKKSGIRFTRKKDMKRFLRIFDTLKLYAFDKDGKARPRWRLTLFSDAETGSDARDRQWKFWLHGIDVEPHQVRNASPVQGGGDKGYVRVDLLATKPSGDPKKCKPGKRPASWGFKVGLYVLAYAYGWDVASDGNAASSADRRVALSTDGKAVDIEEPLRVVSPISLAAEEVEEA